MPLVYQSFWFHFSPCLQSLTSPLRSPLHSIWSFKPTPPFFPPPLSFFLGWDRWSQVGLQTWVMWLRLTHAAKTSAVSVEPAMTQAQEQTHTHTLQYIQTDLVVPTIWNPVMQLAIIITLYCLIIIEKLKMKSSVMRSDCGTVNMCTTQTHTNLSVRFMTLCFIFQQTNDFNNI